MQLSIIRRNILVKVDLQGDAAFSIHISGNSAWFSSPSSFSLSSLTELYLCVPHVPRVQGMPRTGTQHRGTVTALPSVFPGSLKHGLCLAVSIPPGTRGKAEPSLVTAWLGATSCPGVCISNSSCVDPRGTQYGLCRGEWDQCPAV